LQALGGKRMSIFLSVGLTSSLAFRFLVWLKYGRDRLVFAYTISMVLFTTSSLSLAAFVISEIGYNQSIIDSSRISTSTQNVTNFSMKDVQSLGDSRVLDISGISRDFNTCTLLVWHEKISCACAARLAVGAQPSHHLGSSPY